MSWIQVHKFWLCSWCAVFLESVLWPSVHGSYQEANAQPCDTWAKLTNISHSNHEMGRNRKAVAHACKKKHGGMLSFRFVRRLVTHSSPVFVRSCPPIHQMTSEVEWKCVVLSGMVAISITICHYCTYWVPYGIHLLYKIHLPSWNRFLYSYNRLPSGACVWTAQGL